MEPAVCSSRAGVAVLLLLVGTLGASASGVCPSGCECTEASTVFSCIAAGLEVIPIQLNPESLRINLTRNRIGNVQYVLSMYVELHTLDVSRNEIASLDVGNFKYNKKLTHLYLQHNAIETLPKYVFSGLRSLLTLNLQSNKIETVHVHAFDGLVLLEELHLSNNRIAGFGDVTFKSLVNLRVLLLENNVLFDVPTDNLAFTVNLERLVLSGNYIENVTESATPALRRMKRLEMAGNIISAVHPGALDGLLALQFLDLSNNNLTSVPTAALSKLANLTHLSLNGNFFEALPPVSFQSLFHLRHLHLSGLPKLSKIDARAFVDNINLELIWMNDNIKVSVLPTRIFHGNPRLTHISIKNNVIYTLRASHFPLDQLNSLQLGGNPLHCNCSLHWLWKLGQEHLKIPLPLTNASEYTNLYVDFTELHCASPQNIENALLVKVQESAFRCSSGWITVLTIVLSLSVLMSVAGGVLYYVGALKRCSKGKSKHVMTDSDLTSDLPKMSNGLMYGTNHQRASDDKMEINRYLMIAPPAPESYHSTPPWHSLSRPPVGMGMGMGMGPGIGMSMGAGADSAENMYEQFGNEAIPYHRTMERPHIVYV